MERLESTKLMSVRGLVAVITGGGTGLGRTMANTLDINGASNIFIIGRREDRLRETAASAINGSIIPVTGDITSKESLQAAYDTIASQTDHVDLLIANSGTTGRPYTDQEPKSDGSKPQLSELRDKLWSLPMEEFSHVSNVNVTGTFYTILAFLPLLEAANKKRPAPEQHILSPPRPQIIVISSAAGFIRFTPVNMEYHLSKAAVNYMIKLLATTFAEYNIRVNGIAPGFYYSDMSVAFYKSQGIQDKGITDGSFSRNLIPITRGGSEEDIAGLILYMAGAAGGNLNGSIILSDGGSLSIFPSTY
ncbi:short chain dehydrogenase/reductase family [Mariannaea sp. PMI_226]|nr:short chain dehydrogenase/reductase family [Mariannaea sp. PMI_226]